MAAMAAIVVASGGGHATGSAAGKSRAAVEDPDSIMPLDPYQCIAKRNMKYASECTEVYLAKRGASELSDNFRDFPGLEVVWLNGNRLARLPHLETNFRIREVYAQDNRLVSLSGIASFRFLRVLLARNNQLRNLDKQLQLLEKFAFLKKLDLFGNPVAEEPDYRLRLIYRIPQVEILDQRVVKDAERARADEVVPNLDKASAPKHASIRRKGRDLSILEKDCRLEAREIGERRRRAEDEALGQTFSTTVEHRHARQGYMTKEKALNRDMWAEAKTFSLRELAAPTPWEKKEMKLYIERHPVLEGKQDLELDDLARLVHSLTNDGVEEVGRVLGGDVAALPSLGAAGYPASSSEAREPQALLEQGVRSGNMTEVRRALVKGADVNSRGTSNSTPLLAAVRHGRTEIVSLLLDARANVWHRSADGNTALMVAALHGHREVAKMLHERQAADGAPPREVNVHELRQQESQKPPPHPIEKLMAGAAAPTAQVAEWLLSMSWPRASDAKMLARIKREQETHKWAELGRNADALEKSVAASRKALGPALAEYGLAKAKAPKDPKELAAWQLKQTEMNKQVNNIPHALDDAGKTLPQGLIKQLFASRAAKDVPVAIRLEGLRRDRSGTELPGVGAASGGMQMGGRHDVFHQSVLRPKREVDDHTGRTVIKVFRETGKATFGG